MHEQPFLYFVGIELASSVWQFLCLVLVYLDEKKRREYQIKAGKLRRTEWNGRRAMTIKGWKKEERVEKYSYMVEGLS